MKTDMIYRTIGKTGMNASIIGLGAEHLDRKPYETVESVVHAALDNGINIMDLFMPGEEVRKNIGKALAGRRDRMLIQGHICATDVKEQYDISRDLKSIQKYFEDLLRHLQTDYIDFGMLFFIDSEKHFNDVFNGDALPYALKLKEKGHVRALGASTHNPVIARKIVETGLVDLLLFSLNPAFDMVPEGNNVLDYLDKNLAFNEEKNLDPGRQSFYKFCEQRSVSITVMKTLAAGKLLSGEFSPFGKPLTVNQCIHYALTRPAVASVLIGFSEAAHVEKGVSYLNASAEDRDYSSVISGYQGNMKGSCVYCSHCQPCPSEIDIAQVMKYLDIAALDEKNIPALVSAQYQVLKHKAHECVNCGNCEERCPFSVSVMQNMKRATELFGA